MTQEILFYPDTAPVPAELKTTEFYIRPLRASDVDLDYKAVMETRDFLLTRTNGSWPRHGFTIEENLADLEAHEKGTSEKTEFTYTIMNPDETRCLGCIYINPLFKMLRRVLPVKDFESYPFENYEAHVSFWMISECVQQNMDKRLIQSLKKWFAEKWAFSKVILAFGLWLTDRDKEIITEQEEVLNIELKYQGWNLFIK